MNKLQYLILLGVFFAQQIVWGEEYQISDQGTVSAIISDQGVNRVIVENDRIAQVVGNQDEFIIDSDSDLGQIFITPQLKAGRYINVTLITEQGREIDAEFAVKNEVPQTLLLIQPQYKHAKQAKSDTSRYLQENAILHSDSTDTKQETLELLKQLRGDKIKGKNITKLSCIAAYPGLTLENGLLYALEGKTALKVAVRNKSDQMINLDERSFKHCLGKVSAVALETLVLPSKAATYVYVVGKDE